MSQEHTNATTATSESNNVVEANNVNNNINAVEVESTITDAVAPAVITTVATNEKNVETEPTSEKDKETKTTTIILGNVNVMAAKITPAQTQSTKQQEGLAISDAAIQEVDNTTNKGKMENEAALSNFRMLYVLTQLCGITMIILMGCWVGIHLGGFGGTANPSLEFNWHPFLMTIGLIFLYGNSILVYRGFRTTRKKTLKLTHASIHMGAFILTVIALKAVFDSHNLAAKPIPNMYSLHSWLGLSAVLIFCMQYVAGFMAYLVPGLKEQYKIAYMPLHIYFGLFGFVLAIASALMGITEKAFFAIPEYTSLPNSGVICNVCGVLFVIFGGLVVYLTTEPSFKRKPIPEDTVLLTGSYE